MNEYVPIYKDSYFPHDEPFHFERNKIDVWYYPHHHPFYEIEIVTDGGGSTALNGIEYRIGRGSAVILGPSDIHSYICDSGSTLRLNSIKFQEGTIARILSAKTPVVAKFPETVLAEIDRLCGLIETDYQNGGELSETEIRACIELICVSAMKNRIPGSKTDEVTNFDDGKLQSVLACINSNYQKKLTVASLSKMVGYTPNYFSAFFKSKLGITFSEYLGQLRVKLALDYITQTDVSLKKIAYDCGFSSFADFSRVFKKFYGHSPGFYRKSTEK